MYCEKCKSELVDGQCPNCYNPFLEMQPKPDKQTKKYENYNSILLIASLIMFVISIFPLHPAIMWFGLIFSLFTLVGVLILKRKQRDKVQPIVIIFSSVSFVTLSIWLYFIYFIAENL